MASDNPFKVHSPTKITLSPTAREWARTWKMTDREMAEWLLAKHEAGDDVPLPNDDEE
jgi:hypothetical protein